MKKKLLKSMLCISLSTVMVFGEAAIAMAAAPGEGLDSVTASAEMIEEGTGSIEGTESTEVAVPSTEVAVPSTEVTVPSTEVTVPSTENAETVAPSTEVTVPSAENTETVAPSTEEKINEEIDSVGKKVVDFATLETVTGIGYDAKKKTIFWNKVPNATRYVLEVMDNATGEKSRYNSYSTSREFYRGTGSYTVSINALDDEEYYLAGSNISEADYDNYGYVSKENFGAAYINKVAGGINTYTVYNYPMSAAPGVYGFQIAANSDSARTISVISAILFKEVTETNMVFEVINAPELLDGEKFEWEYSNNAEFRDDELQGLFKKFWHKDEDTIEVSLSQFSLGEVCYVRARVFGGNYEPDVNLDWEEWNAQKYSAYTAAVSYAIPEAVVSGVSATVSGRSITLSTSLESGSVTGYQFAKKTGKNWVAIAKQTDSVYKDSGLTENISYRYRVRGYSYNKRTGKTKYTGWKYVNAKTWGANLKLKASAASSTSVKLSWNKISGAKGYEIYRIDTSSAGQNYTDGNYDDGFANYTLVKTITKSKTISYTDKKLTSGNTYTYLVRAYTVNGKDKNYINSQASVSLNASGFQVQNGYYTSSGSYKVAWQKMTGIKGFKVEKKNPVTGKYDVVKKLSKTATSYTAASVAVGNANEDYRIRPYTGSRTYEGHSFTVVAKLGTVKNVKASAASEGIQVSWSPVAGADYYRVYRTTDTNYTYNKTTKTYSYSYGETVYDSAVDINGYHPELGDYMSDDYAGTYKNSEIKVASVLDRTVTYTEYVTDASGKKISVKDAAGNVVKNAEGRTVYQTKEAVWNNGPEKGVTYSYYVRAYAKEPNGQNTSAYCQSASDSKAATAIFTDKTVKKVSKISSVKSKKKGEATISYKKASGASGYAIYRATSKKGTYVLVGTSTKTSYTDAGLASGKTYYYKVASYTLSEAKANIYSAKTSYKSVKVK